MVSIANMEIPQSCAECTLRTGDTCSCYLPRRRLLMGSGAMKMDRTEFCPIIEPTQGNQKTIEWTAGLLELIAKQLMQIAALVRK